MEFKRVDPQCKFTIPDTITVRQQMAFFSASLAMGTPDYQERLWFGAQALIQDWECPVLPNRDVDLDKVTDSQITMVMLWTGTQVKNHLNRAVFSIPKN